MNPSHEEMDETFLARLNDASSESNNELTWTITVSSPQNENICDQSNLISTCSPTEGSGSKEEEVFEENVNELLLVDVQKNKIFDVIGSSKRKLAIEFKREAIQLALDQLNFKYKAKRLTFMLPNYRDFLGVTSFCRNRIFLSMTLREILKKYKDRRRVNAKSIKAARKNDRILKMTFKDIILSFLKSERFTKKRRELQNSSIEFFSKLNQEEIQ